jgi:hypothetical protein
MLVKVRKRLVYRQNQKAPRERMPLKIRRDFRGKPKRKG